MPTDPTMVVLRPGDRVLIAMSTDPDPDEAQSWAHELHTVFPGVEFVFLGGVAALAVMAPS